LTFWARSRPKQLPAGAERARLPADRRASLKALSTSRSSPAQLSRESKTGVPRSLENSGQPGHAAESVNTPVL